MSRIGRKDPFAERYGEFAERLGGDRWQPDADVIETGSGVVVRVDLAGVRRDDLKVTMDGQLLRINGTRSTPETRDVRRLHQMEIVAGPFERRVRVPIAVDRDGVTAHLSDGFLTVHLPKRSPVPVKVETE